MPVINLDPYLKSWPVQVRQQRFDVPPDPNQGPMTLHQPFVHEDDLTLLKRAGNTIADFLWGTTPQETAQGDVVNALLGAMSAGQTVTGGMASYLDDIPRRVLQGVRVNPRATERVGSQYLDEIAKIYREYAHRAGKGYERPENVGLALTEDYTPRTVEAVLAGYRRFGEGYPRGIPDADWLMEPEKKRALVEAGQRRLFQNKDLSSIAGEEVLPIPMFDRKGGTLVDETGLLQYIPSPSNDVVHTGNVYSGVLPQDVFEAHAKLPEPQRGRMPELETLFQSNIGGMTVRDILEREAAALASTKKQSLRVGDLFHPEGVSPELALRTLAPHGQAGIFREATNIFDRAPIYPDPRISPEGMRLDNIPLEDLISMYLGQRVRHGNTLRITPFHDVGAQFPETADPFAGPQKRWQLYDELVKSISDPARREEFFDRSLDLEQVGGLETASPVGITAFPNPELGTGYKYQFDSNLGARIVQGNHRLDALRRAVRAREVSPNTPIPTLMHWVGEGFTEPSGWFPRSQMEQFLQTPISDLPQAQDVQSTGAFLEALLQQWKGQPYKENAKEIIDLAATIAGGKR